MLFLLIKKSYISQRKPSLYSEHHTKETNSKGVTVAAATVRWKWL